MDQVMNIVIALAVLAFIAWLFIVLPYQMARKRNRSKAGWVLISVLISPIIAIVVLLALGDAQPKDDIAETFA